MVISIATETLILRVGSIAGAVAATLALIAMVLRFSVKQFTKAVKSEMEDNVGPRLTQIEQHTIQLTPNGGTSVADVVRRLETRQMTMQAELQAQRDALLEHFADHRRLTGGI